MKPLKILAIFFAAIIILTACSKVAVQNVENWPVVYSGTFNGLKVDYNISPDRKMIGAVMYCADDNGKYVPFMKYWDTLDTKKQEGSGNFYAALLTNKNVWVVGDKAEYLSMTLADGGFVFRFAGKHSDVSRFVKKVQR